MAEKREMLGFVNRVGEGRRQKTFFSEENIFIYFI